MKVFKYSILTIIWLGWVYAFCLIAKPEYILPPTLPMISNPFTAPVVMMKYFWWDNQIISLVFTLFIVASTCVTYVAKKLFDSYHGKKVNESKQPSL